MRKTIVLFALVALIFTGFVGVAPAFAATDVCANIAGDQAEVPEGYYEKDGNCFKKSGNGNPMNAPCFPELGFGTCGQKLSSGAIKHVKPGEGSCPAWFPSGGCLEVVALKPATPQIIHLNYGETSHGYTCDYKAGCELDLGLVF